MSPSLTMIVIDMIVIDMDVDVADVDVALEASGTGSSVPNQGNPHMGSYA